MLVSTRDYPQAIAQLGQLKKLEPEQAQWYFPALAFAYLQTGDMEKARENAENAKKWAKTPQQIEHANAMLEAATVKKPIVSKSLVVAEETNDGRPRIRRVERPEFSIVKQVTPANPFIAKE